VAKIWPANEAGRATTGGPWAVLPLVEAVPLLSLEPEHLLTDRSDSPGLGDTEENTTWVACRHVLVEVGDDEATTVWKPGLYLPPLRPAEAFLRLVARRIERGIGLEWRVELEEGLDADGDPALWAWITLRAEAPTDRLAWANRERVRAEVRNTVAEAGISDWVYVRFREEQEEVGVA
jgi:hypothetical protein